MRHLSRALAVTAAAALLAAGVAAPALAAPTGALTNLSPTGHFNDASSFTLSMTTQATYVPGTTVTVTLSGPGADSARQYSGTATGTNAVAATLTVLDLNPGSYGVTVGIQSAVTDACTACFTVSAYAPQVSAVSPSTFAEGTTGGAYSGFNLQGQNFAHGPYPQCAALPCTGPAIAFRRSGTTTLDGNVTLTDTTPTATAPTETSITKRIALAGTDTVAYDDDVIVYNSDGRSGVCAACLHVLPQPTVTGVALKLADGTTLPEIGQNATKQTVVVSGHDLPSDARVSFVAPGTPPSTTAGSISFASASAPVTVGDHQEMTLTDVDTSKVTTAADGWGLQVSSPSTHATSAKTAFPVKPAPTATDVAYPSGASNPGRYGQGATGVHLVASGTNLSSAGQGTQVVFTSAPTGVAVKSQTLDTTAGTVDVSLDVAPGTTTGSYAFHLVNPDGGTSADCSNATTVPPVANSCLLTVGPGPVFASVSPATVTGGFVGTVTVKGTFHTGTNAVHVVIGPNSGGQTYASKDVTPLDASTLSVSGVTVPAGDTVQDLNVVVTNNDDEGSATAAKAFHVANLSVDLLSPNAWTNDTATTVKVDGSHLAAGQTTAVWLVKAGQATLQATAIADVTPDTGYPSALSATFDLAGVAPGGYDVEAINSLGSNQGTAVCTGCFTVNAPAPTASAVTPAAAGGGASDVTVTVTGAHFFPGTTMSFSNQHVHLLGSPVVASGTVTQHVSIDNGATADTGTVTVTNSDGQSVSKPFTVNPAPTVSSLSPAQRAAGTTFTLTVNGSGFATSPAPTLAFDQTGVTASGYAVNAGGTTLTATVALASSITTGNPVEVHVTVVNSDQGQGESPVALTVTPQPVVSSVDTGRVDPATAPAGATVTLHVYGAHFQDGVTLAPHALGSGLTITGVTRVSDTEVDATVAVDPAAAAGARTLDLGNPDGGATSTQLSVITPSTAPRNVSGTGGVRSATVQWEVPAVQGGSAVTQYTVALQNADPNGASPAPQTVTTLSATFNGLLDGATYAVNVVATNDAGHSAAGTATVTTDTFPDAPSGLKLTGGVHAITAQWSAPQHDGGSPLTSYSVRAVNDANSSDAHSSGPIDPAVTTYQVSGLASGATYTLSVVATTAVGDSPAVVGTATTYGVPGAPTGVTAARGLRRLDVSWSAPASDVPVTAYRVRAVNTADAADAHDSGPLSSSTVTYQVTGLKDGATYAVSVTATSAAGDSAASTVTQTTFALPGTPTGVQVVPGDRQATVSWSAPATDGGTPITSYVVGATPGNVTRTVSSVAPVTLTGLTNGVLYSFTVTAVNAVGGTASAAVDDMPLGVSTISLGSLPSKVVFGTTLTLSGSVSRTDASAAFGEVGVFVRYDNGTTKLLTTLTPSSSGAYSYKVTQRYNTRYLTAYSGDDKNDWSFSVARAVAAAAKVTAVAPTGSHLVRATVYGGVAPNKAGTIVTLYRVTSSGSFVRLGYAKLTSTSTYRFSVYLPKGYSKLVVTVPKTANNLAGAVRIWAYRT